MNANPRGPGGPAFVFVSAVTVASASVLFYMQGQHIAYNYIHKCLELLLTTFYEILVCELYGKAQLSLPQH